MLPQVNRIWTAHTFKRLYQDVLDERLKIRVREIRDDGTYILHVYEETGWWIFKHRWPRRDYYLKPGKDDNASYLNIRLGP